MKYDVFISYSRKDTAIADQVCAAFDEAKISYFIDRQGIGGGMEFPKVLAENILNSQIFLFLASKNSYASPFTDREITFAFNNKKGENMFPYIIDYEPFPKHLELIFASNNWRRLAEHPIETVLIDDIFKLLGRNRQETETVSQQNNKKESNNSTDLLSKQKKNILEEFPEYGFKPTSLIKGSHLNIIALFRKVFNWLAILFLIASMILFILYFIWNEGKILFNGSVCVGGAVGLYLLGILYFRIFRYIKPLAEIADYIQVPMKNRYIFFVKNSKFGVFNKNWSKICVPAEYDKLSWKTKNMILIAEQNGETFLIDIKGNRLY